MAAFAVIYIIWGSTYLGIRFAIETMPPFLMAGLRFIIPGCLLFLWSCSRYKDKPKLMDWKKAAVPGILMFVGGNGCLTWAEQFIPSGFASLMIATIPVWMVLLDWILFHSKRPDRLTVAGVLMGITGVALLTGADETILIQTRTGDSLATGILVLLFASLSWSAGSLWSRHIKDSVALPFTISMQVITGGFALLVIAFAKGEFARLSLESISLRSFLSLVYLMLFGTLLAYSAYIWLLRASTPAKVGTYAFFNPLVAVFLGWLLAGESVTTMTVFGAVFILGSILLVYGPVMMKKGQSEKL